MQDTWTFVGFGINLLQLNSDQWVRFYNTTDPDESEKIYDLLTSKKVEQRFYDGVEVEKIYLDTSNGNYDYESIFKKLFNNETLISDATQQKSQDIKDNFTEEQCQKLVEDYIERIWYNHYNIVDLRDNDRLPVNDRKIIVIEMDQSNTNATDYLVYSSYKDFLFNYLISIIRDEYNGKSGEFYLSYKELAALGIEDKNMLDKEFWYNQKKLHSTIIEEVNLGEDLDHCDNICWLKVGWVSPQTNYGYFYFDSFDSFNEELNRIKALATCSKKQITDYLFWLNDNKHLLSEVSDPLHFIINLLFNSEVDLVKEAHHCTK